MTAARTPDLTAVERAQIDAWEAAAYAEEALRERVARAVHDAEYLPCRDGYDDCLMADHYRRLADAALAVVRTPVEVHHA